MNDQLRDENYYKVYPLREKEELSEGEVILVCSPLRFYTKNDENWMFRWIKKIKCITKFYGIGQSLHLIVCSNKISIECLLELIGLFRRYKFDVKQLKVFMNKGNKAVFKSLDKI